MATVILKGAVLNKFNAQVAMQTYITLASQKELRCDTISDKEDSYPALPGLFVCVRADMCTLPCTHPRLL